MGASGVITLDLNPMIHVVLPDNNVRRLPFYLAMEEWVARALPAGEYFFTWSVKPTVIIGRNQDLVSEVNLDYCREHGIDVCRRRSGGGCVYADGCNIMMSHVCAETDVEAVFRRYTALVAGQLRAIGIPAEPTGRNDIVVEGRKISGNAFYSLPGRSIVHGTMLYDTDIANMLNAITPSRAKLESKQVQSVESRITMANRHRPDMTFGGFHAALTEGLETSRRVLTEAEIASVARIEQEYYAPDWVLYGRSHRSRRQQANQLQKVDGVGCLAVSAPVDSAGRIESFEVTGDFFGRKDASALEALIVGARRDSAELVLRLASIDVGEYITGMTTEPLVELIVNS